MTDIDWATERFEEQRPRLRSMAYRMLGSLSEADDAVQEAWIRVNRADADSVDNIGGWLTTIVARVCLNMLRSRESRGEQPLDVHVPDPVVSPADGMDPEHEALLADSVGLALLVVLDTLSPSERLAYVLHDMFAIPFDDIATVIEKSPEATRQLASRARRRVQGQAPKPDRDLDRQREVVNAFFAAAREGDFDALVSVLDPDIVLRADGGRLRAGQTMVLNGAASVAGQAKGAEALSKFVTPALVNGVPGAVIAPKGNVQIVIAFTVTDGKIAAIDILLDPERLKALDVSGVF